jgi:DNA-binding GntR family transcriptional regulator
MSLFASGSTSQNLGEQAYKTLRESIITLQFEPGQTIYESEIASAFNISRTPIRDAFQLLIAEGLIDVLPQRTKKIAYISEAKVKESGFIRLSLESSAFRLVARYWDDTERYMIAEKEIKRILQAQSDAAEQQDYYQFLQLDESFHRTILQLTGNETLLGVVYHMRGYLNRFRYLAMKELVMTKNLVDEHCELFKGLKSQDEKQVIQLLEHHLCKFESEIPRLNKAYKDYFTE